MPCRCSTIVAALVLFALASGGAALSAESTVRRIPDVAYVDGIGGDDRRRLDIYASPEADGPRPPRSVVIFVHGGGWFRGDRARVHHKAEWLVGEGFVFVSVGYRLAGPSGTGGHPENVEDIAAAIAWLHAHVAEYGGDPGRMFIIGHSSGAHLAALVATDGRRLKRHGLSPDVLAGVVAIDTDAFDVGRLIAEVEPEARPLYLAVFGRHPDGWRDASPAEHVSGDEPTPPFLLLVAGQSRRKDALVGSFRRALLDADVKVEIERFRRETHGSISARMGLAGHRPSAALLRFLRRHGE